MWQLEHAIRRSPESTGSPNSLAPSPAFRPSTATSSGNGSIGSYAVADVVRCGPLVDAGADASGAHAASAVRTTRPAPIGQARARVVRQRNEHSVPTATVTLGYPRFASQAHPHPYGTV